MSGILLNLSSDNRTPDSLGTDDFTIQFNSPIPLGDNIWEVSVVSANMWNTNPNISSTLYNNDYFSYFNGAINQVITLPEGTYSVPAINAAIKKQLQANGDLPGNITFVANTATLKVEITTIAPYTVDLGTGSLLYELLGFSLAQIAAPIGPGTVSGANVADINRGVNNIYLRCDIINPIGSYDSPNSSQILTDLAFQGRPIGSSVYIEKKYQMWIPVKRAQQLNTVRVRITDQLNRRYSFRDQPVNVQLYMRPAKTETNKKLFENVQKAIIDSAKSK